MAGNARFHNKYHRANHHSNPSTTIPDSASDPIASRQEPFMGDFFVFGALSARDGFCTQGLSGINYSNTINGVTYTWKNGILVSATP
jgi:hypothetical protein